ncbi:flagellar biosynthesis anti-sigma factor FlgM [Cohnella cholangitidis]|uniref:Flagellar biosynthesis anti-sigma factor FlgM n=1 Tax=Cohnella cholangitidis TaxID=2598458 RepID=A0A7G5BXK0_9BACL|nr:flagellar biosynthesis anti-sigma factor FlgM [Cohnella cholangitidis]
MKINDTQRIGAYRTYQQQSDARTNQTAGKRRKDEVQFSAEAMELLNSRQPVADPDRAKRIEQLKNEVATGNYYVEDHLIIEKLLPFLK